MPHLSPTASALLLAGALLVPAAPAHAAQEDTGPADLAVSLSGSSEGVAGGTGDWTIGVASTGGSAAPDVRVTLALPADVTLSSVGVTDDWSCVAMPEDRQSPLSCVLERALPPGQSAAGIPVVLSYGSAASGTVELAAVAHQGRDGAMRMDRGTATITFAAPATASPSPVATTAPPAPRPSATRPATVAPRPVTVQEPVDEPADEPADEPVGAPVEDAAQAVPPAPAPPAPEETQPSSLPFVDDEPTAPAEEQEEETTEETTLAASSDGDGTDLGTLLLGWLFGITLLAVLVLGFRILTGRTVPLRGA